MAKPEKKRITIGEILDAVRSGELDLSKRDISSLQKAVEERNASGRYRNKQH